MVSVDARSNLLTVETREGDRVSYNPALLKQQTDRSSVYMEESRVLAQGEAYPVQHREPRASYPCKQSRDPGEVRRGQCNHCAPGQWKHRGVGRRAISLH